ncbi:hypothetical protein JCM17844_20150 [Iodidimonas gelatinilytica]|uniref:Uncharacterized protein n=1 Tax=Iodidimonas gelatinilytica TaxID=1236966 RepID=A0A5A7MTQ3_9PROT|nr:hypothetical protein JCM17844_20150 [Iodidimonas gelatinilytica]GER00430.1 hypothetical protein JCM17845_10530 [Iodidimonas gelatinilytica]
MGALLIVGSTLYIARREAQLARREAIEKTQATPAQPPAPFAD